MRYLNQNSPTGAMWPKRATGKMKGLHKKIGWSQKFLYTYIFKDNIHKYSPIVEFFYKIFDKKRHLLGLKIFISDKSLIKLKPLNIDKYDEKEIWELKIKLIKNKKDYKDIIYIIINCQHYISHDHGDT
ncbi:hypothetical protein A3Q56_06703 [Intoshia linei]|uniref:Uncharacterized protein n=1 Tax=Intoshia linei TaxID=1819745 RepID=A0A177AUC2_9BILA|nr:hypothetical protein A3Q56_06703 [Intoshia linei]